MEFKNLELRPIAKELLELRKEKLATKLSLAITKSINALSTADGEYDQTRIGILEAHATKGEDGKCILKPELMKSEAGEEVTLPSYQFDNEEAKVECFKKIGELMNTKVEVAVSEITEEDILNEERLSPESVQTLLMLVKK